MSADKNNDRILKPSGRIVASLPEPVEIKLHTRCPHKWVIVDMESGELWGHDGQHFHRLSDPHIGEVVDVTRMAGTRQC